MKIIKLTPEEVETLQNLKTQNESIVKEFGLIHLAKLNLNSREERAETFLTNVRTTEVDIAKTLEDKYGKGTVNLSTGEFNSTAS